MPAFAEVAPQRHQQAGIADLAGLAGSLGSEPPGSAAGVFRRRGAEAILGYLAAFPGDGWQQRWQASGLELAGPTRWALVMWRSLGFEPTAARTGTAASGLGALIALDVVRPRFGFLFESRFGRLWHRLAAWRGDPDACVLSSGPGTAQSRSHAAGALGRLLVLTGRPVRQLRAADLLAYRDAVLARRSQSLGLEHLWACLAEIGVLEGTLRQALRPGQRTVAELVDAHGLASSRVRGLLIAYLTERAPVIDYSTLRGRASDLCGLFWREVERIAPGIDTIDLPGDVARRWKEQARWRTLPDGRQVPRANILHLLMSVRGFYADLNEMARDDPGRWAAWACKPPVTPHDVKAYAKWRHQLRSTMHERTRTRTVHVAELADVAERRYQDALTLLQAARQARPGQTFTAGGRQWTRTDQALHDQAHPRVVPATGDGPVPPSPADTVQDEEDAFWGMAVVEVLRHTGIRIEEMLELTQLDLHEYQHRDPAVGLVLLLHVNPSKLDQERMLVISPELAAVLAVITRRVRAAARRAGPPPGRLRLRRVQEQRAAALPVPAHRGQGIQGHHPAGHPRLRPPGPRQDLPRSRAHRPRREPGRLHPPTTSAASSPPKPCPPASRRTSSRNSWATHRYPPPRATPPSSPTTSSAPTAFTQNRRQQRPAAEYRPVTTAEWDEFEQHFAKRKIAIGDCMRAYGTSCAHEYACEQCKLARPDPGARPRLERTRDGLLTQMHEARDSGWAGETERLASILAGVNDKLAELDRQQRRTIWLPTPAISAT